MPAIFCPVCRKMMDIVEPRDDFDFSTISLAHPVGVQAGAYFTKIEYKHKPLYIQTTKSATRQGFVKSGKKYYCDLMFTANDGHIIHWLENLEERCKKLLYEKKDAWFQGSLEESDVEHAFNPLLRIYKSGKFYLLRANIKNHKDDETPNVKIYNEHEVEVAMSEVTSDTEMIAILEIQGIKFTPRNFQIEIEMKQTMVLSNEPIFQSCLIKTHKTPAVHTDFSLQPTIIRESEPILAPGQEPLEQELLEQKEPEPMLEEQEPVFEEQEPLEQEPTLEEFDLELNEVTPGADIEFEVEDLGEEESEDALKEFDPVLTSDVSGDPLTLKKPNQVYFELYKKARDKAKQAKKSAILAYLEAKNIKKTYMIDHMNDDDSDGEFDAEIDDASESELEGL